ncbi:MAG: AAA-like domain-containing protein [Xenococcaceae cyanobacterium]
MPRPPIEKTCFREIEQEGALLKIKAPQKMGKSLLLKKIFEYVQPKNYGRVQIDLHQLESSMLLDYSQFLRWFCQRVSKRLKLSDCLADYWGEMTPNTNCTDYFEEHILERLETPLLLGIDNIDRIFAPQFQSIATDFCGLLRSWWGFAQTTGGNWTKLRLIVIYSTEDLPKLNIHQSPFNVGTEIKLPDFDDEQVLELALKYGLNWSLIQVQQLKEQIGGHPYLVHKAIKNFKLNPKLTLTDLLKKAATDEGIYAHHLQHHWSTLEQETNLVQQLKTIVEASEPIAIAPTYLYKLDSMGLITKVGYQVKPRCQLYRQYFRERLLTLNDS